MDFMKGWRLRVHGTASVDPADPLVAALAGAVYGVRIGVAHVVASPRFAVQELRIGAAAHLDRDQIAALSGVTLGDRLLAQWQGGRGHWPVR